MKYIKVFELRDFSKYPPREQNLAYAATYLEENQPIIKEEKYIKEFESVNIGEPKKGYWVICTENTYLKDFLNNNVGYCYENEEEEVLHPFIVGYTNVPDDVEAEFNRVQYKGKNLMSRVFDREEILYWSKNKKELQTIIAGNKYNL